MHELREVLTIAGGLMSLTLSFRFLNNDLNRRLIDLVRKSEAKHFVAKDGVVHYSPDDEEFFENELISSVRNEVFDSWQLLFFPKEWAEQYKTYMERHDVPFREELANDEVCFLIPRRYRPASWKIDAPPRHALRSA